MADSIRGFRETQKNISRGKEDKKGLQVSGPSFRKSKTKSSEETWTVSGRNRLE